MTDADVDGAHIRTLLLTFFYRQMPELVERGYIYIAQPPLYKIKHGKSERYIKDDHELNQHLLTLALDGAAADAASWTPHPIEGDALGELARAYLLSEAVIKRLADFIEPGVLHALLAHDIALDLADEAAAQRQRRQPDALRVPRASASLPNIDDKTESWRLRIEKMRHGNLRIGHIDEEFLLSGDYAQIRKTAQMLAGLIGTGASYPPRREVAKRHQLRRRHHLAAQRSRARPRQAALQRPGRNEPRAAVGNHHGPDRAPPAQGADRRRHRRRRNLHHPDGRRRRTAPGVHRIQRALRAQYRRLSGERATESLGVNDELAIMRTFLKGRLDIEPGRITPAANLAELEIDSLILLELFFEFEEQFGLNLAKDIPTPKTIGELVDIVKGLRRATAAG